MHSKKAVAEKDGTACTELLRAVFFYFHSGCKMTDTDKFNDIYLNLEIRKSTGKTDDYGNYIFEVEASNENLDLQNQIVLQRALMESKDEFLKGGVISFDHLHKRRDEKGNIISDPSMVIGEPIDVYFDEENKKTIVKGKLYSNNDKAKDLIKMLKAGSTRVRASVGGIFPQVVKNLKTGVEKITHVLWNDLAITTSPVNNTVGSAVFAKSMSAAEFVNYLPLEIKKSLCAGYNTDSATMTGGQTLIPEDTKTKCVDVSNTQAINKSDVNEKEIIAQLVELAKNRRINGEDDAIEFLVLHGISKEKAGEITSEIINQGGQMMKKSFSNTVSDLLKSLTGGNPKDNDEDIMKGNEDGANADDENLDDENDIDLDDEDEDEDEDKENEDDGENDDEDMVDGGEMLKALDATISTMAKSQKATEKRLNDLGEAIVGLAEMVSAIGNQKIPPRTVLNKSMNAGGGNSAGKQNLSARPTEDDLYNMQLVLKKAVDEGEIDMIQSSMISSDFQKCMHTGRPMNPKYYEFLQTRLNKGAK